MNKKFDFHKEHKYVNQYENKRKAGDSIENKDAFNMGYDAGLSDRVTGHKNEINDRDQWVNEVLESAGFDLTEENLHDFKEGYWTGYEMESYHEETGEEAVREPFVEIIDEEDKAEDSKYSEEYHYLQDKLLEYERKGIGTKKEYERNRARLAEIQDLEWNDDEQLHEYSFEVPEDLAELIRNDEYDAENLIYWFRDDFGHEVEIAYDDGLLTFYNMNEEELDRAKELEDESEEWYDEVLDIIND